MCDGGLEGILSLPLPGGNGLNCYITIRSHETDASVVSAAIKCQAGVCRGPAAADIEGHSTAAEHGQPGRLSPETARPALGMGENRPAGANPCGEVRGYAQRAGVRTGVGQ